jgi:cytochrome c oxidase assembly protein subunit 15
MAIAGDIPRRMLPRLAALFVLGGLQGAVGWFMVASGFFADSTAVDAYRLVAHLCLGLLLFTGVLWTALSTWRPDPQPVAGGLGLRRLAAASAALLGLAIMAGGFTAGLHAGLAYNTFPLMDGRVVPAGYASLHPWLRNLTENTIAVQFDHRLLATLAAVTILATLATALRPASWARLPQSARTALVCMAAFVLVQYGLGVATLLSVVAIPLAVAHQANSVLLLGAAIAAIHSLRGAYRIANN